MVFVTDGVTETEWLLTVPFVAVGVPAVPDGMAFICTELNPSYPASAVIVWLDVVGAMFVFACRLGLPPLYEPMAEVPSFRCPT